MKEWVQTPFGKTVSAVVLGVLLDVAKNWQVYGTVGQGVDEIITGIVTGLLTAAAVWVKSPDGGNG